MKIAKILFVVSLTILAAHSMTFAGWLPGKYNVWAIAPQPTTIVAGATNDMLVFNATETTSGTSSTFYVYLTGSEISRELVAALMCAYYKPKITTRMQINVSGNTLGTGTGAWQEVISVSIGDF